MKTAIKIVYMFVLAIFINLTFALAITAFYQPPKYPEYPSCDYYNSSSSYSSLFNGDEDDSCKEEREEYEKKSKEYPKQLGAYGRNIFIILTLISLLVITAAIFIKDISKTLAAGVMLGGIFTMIFGQGITFFNYIFSMLSALPGFWGGNGDYNPTIDNAIRFIAALLGLIVLIVLGLLKFRDEDSGGSPTYEMPTYTGPDSNLEPSSPVSPPLSPAPPPESAPNSPPQSPIGTEKSVDNPSVSKPPETTIS
ncbi:MAG: hypothetical protein GTN40_00340 [Candidatus Aenigmarchaeota archaeon]|nr:hypothetical protein [Candidatus Aenigmarchaeota archaeon]